MKEIIPGKKTYITVGLIVLVVAARTFELIDENAYQVLLGLLGAGAIASLRLAVQKAK